MEKKRKKKQNNNNNRFYRTLENSSLKFMPELILIFC